MIKRSGKGWSRLSAWLVISLVLFIIVATAAAGMPAIMIVQSQLDQHAWRLVAQGRDFTQALYSAQQNDLENLAILIAQRPTLQRLVAEGAVSELEAYLETLRQGGDIDLIVVCAVDQQVLVEVGKTTTANICGNLEPTRYYTEKDQWGSSIWLISAKPVEKDMAIIGHVIIGFVLDGAFVADMQYKTGLDQILLVGREPVVSSHPDQLALWRKALQEPAVGVNSNPSNLASITFETAQTFFTERFPLDGDIENLVALSVTDIALAKRQLSQTIIANLLIVMIVGSAAGILLGRTIGRPLADLRDAATTFKKGDLVTPVMVKTRLPEVSIVASSLEDARVALRNSLTELRHEKEWIENLLESIVEGIVTLDRRQRITFFSHGAEVITGLKQEQVLGLNCDEVFELAGGEGNFSQWIPVPGKRQKMVISLPDGRKLTLAVTGARLAPLESRQSPVALVLRDISDEDELHQLLGNFLINITHEFRTPLSALAVSVELMLDELHDLDQAELHELLVSHYLGVVNLQTLIDNLLEGASIEAGRFRVYPRQADLREIVGESVRVMKPLMDKYGHCLRIDLPAELPPVQVDSRRTIQVLVNLLSNAVKYSPPESEVFLTVSQEDEFLRVTVADQGTGIPGEFHQIIFHRYRHLSSEMDTAQYGVGLGLMVVKAIVEAQGGMVGVSDAPSGGAVFWITLPIAVEAERAG